MYFILKLMKGIKEYKRFLRKDDMIGDVYEKKKKQVAMSYNDTFNVLIKLKATNLSLYFKYLG